MTETVIETIKDRGTITGADHHICQITGETYIPKAHILPKYRNGGKVLPYRWQYLLARPEAGLHRDYSGIEDNRG